MRSHVGARSAIGGLAPRQTRAACGSTDTDIVRTVQRMRTNRLELRLTDEERDLDTCAADAVGETLSEFFRRAAHDRATSVIGEQRRIELGNAEARRFLEALDTPDPESVAALRELWLRPVDWPER